MSPRPMILVASLVILAGCTSQSDGDDSNPTDEESPASTAPQVVEGQPIEFDLEVPEGFTLAGDEDRPELVAEDHISYVFALDDAGEGDRLMVTSYVLPEAVAAGDFDALVAVIADYDEQRGQPNEAEKYLHAMVNRMSGVHRYVEIGEDATVKQYSHYVAVDSHLVQITCQWERDYTSVINACHQMEQDFPVPDGWDAVDWSTAS